MSSDRKGDTSRVENRMQTRASNTDKHPGAILQAASRVRRDPTVIQMEKKEKDQKRDKRTTSCSRRGCGQ